MLLRTIRASGHGFYLIGSVRSLREKNKVLRSQTRLKKGPLETSVSSPGNHPQWYIIWEKNLGR